MKIIKQPIYTCKCGTSFVVEATDHLECLWEDPADFLNHRTFIKCPTCNQYVEINEVTENE